MIYLFYECEDSNVASYADYRTPYSCATGIPRVALDFKHLDFSVVLKITICKLIQENPIFYLVPRNLRYSQSIELLLLQVPTEYY